MSKIKLVSGKEVSNSDKIYWIIKSDLIINWLNVCDLAHSELVKETEDCSECFATKQEAEEWLEKYKAKNDHTTRIYNKPKEVLLDTSLLHTKSLQEIEEIYNNHKTIKPNYYKSKSGQDVLDVIEDFDLDFYMGNCIKYCIRAGKKDKETTIQDLQKAMEYIDRKIKSLEK